MVCIFLLSSYGPMNFLPCTVQILVVLALVELEFIGMLGITEPIDEKDLRALMEANL
jgi:hypothetical protein